MEALGTANNDEGDAKIVRQSPVPPLLLLIPKLRQLLFILLFDRVGGSAFDRCL